MKKVNLPPCVIMAGGMGTRLGALTKNTPKPALKINGKPFILYLLEWLKKNGFKEIFIIASYKYSTIFDLIEDYSKNQKKLSIKIIRDKKMKGTFNAVKLLVKIIKGNFFYTNADEINFFNPNKMYLEFKKNKSKVSSLIHYSKVGNLDINEKNKIIVSKNIQKGKYLELGCKFININIFTKKRFNFDKIEDFLYGHIIFHNKINYYIAKRMPIRIDTSHDIKETKKFLHPNE